MAHWFQRFWRRLTKCLRPVRIVTSVPALPMDEKQLEELKYLHSRISAGHFDECDAKLFMLMLREEQSPIIREFGDFVAHRKRDKGRVHSFVTSVQALLKEIEKTGKEPTQKRLARLHRGVFTCEEIYRAINETLARLGLQRLTEERTALLLFVTLFTLNAAELVEKSKHLGKLHLCIDRESVKLRVTMTHELPDGGVNHWIFSLITMPNHFYPMPRSRGTMQVPPIAAIRIENGKMVSTLEELRLKIQRRARGIGDFEPITWDEVRAGLVGLQIALVDDAQRFFAVRVAPEVGTVFHLKGDGTIEFSGALENQRPDSPVWKVALALSRRLNALIYDSTGLEVLLEDREKH